MTDSMSTISKENPFGEGVPHYHLPDFEIKDDEEEPFQLFQGLNLTPFGTDSQSLDRNVKRTSTAWGHSLSPGLGALTDVLDEEPNFFQQTSPNHRRPRSNRSEGVTMGGVTHQGWSNWSEEDIKKLRSNSAWQMAENARLTREMEHKDNLLDALTKHTSELRSENSHLKAQATQQTVELTQLRSRISKTTFERASSVEERNQYESKLKQVMSTVAFEVRKHQRFVESQSGTKREKQQRLFGLEILDRVQDALDRSVEEDQGILELEDQAEFQRLRQENAELQVELRQAWRWKKLLEENRVDSAKKIKQLKTENKKLTKEAKKREAEGRKREKKAADQTKTDAGGRKRNKKAANLTALEDDLRVANKRVQVLIKVNEDLRKKALEQKQREHQLSSKSRKS